MNFNFVGESQQLVPLDEHQAEGVGQARAGRGDGDQWAETCHCPRQGKSPSG